MMFEGKTALITGGGTGIGRALARDLVRLGVQVCVADKDGDAAFDVARDLGCHAVTCDVSVADDVTRMIRAAGSALGQIDILISNAGFAQGAVDGPCSVGDEQWQASWDVHVMSHVRAVRLVLPDMIARGEGWLVNVASAAGLLSQIGDAPYSASKHAAVSLAQSLAIEHGDDGIHVSVVCPLYVATPLLGYEADAPENRPNDRVLTAQEVSASIVDGLEKGQFLILPHAEAATYFARRAGDMDRWVSGMRGLRRQAFSDGIPKTLTDLHRKI